MYNDQNIFAKIIRKEIPANIIFENQDVISFADISPAAKIHVLVIPKKPYISYSDFIAKASDIEIVSFFKSIETIIDQLDIKAEGYRLITNHGEDGGQLVEHFHVHILAGEKLGLLNSSL